MEHSTQLSADVYLELCHTIGSPTEVKMRREVVDTGETVRKLMTGLKHMESGSRREGFRLITSDFDVMYWPSNHKVICDLSQVSLYCIRKNTLILMECDDLQPGFTRLILLCLSNNKKIRISCIAIENNLYISSVLFREICLRSLQNSSVGSKSKSHGPCSTLPMITLELDSAFCLQSHHWPAIALPWIHRCRQQGWPCEDVISDILSTGYHIVPIGSTPESSLEWRISFSCAEQKIIYSMNHCQFLCYGVFKIFLKEVINFNNDSPVLCSYFIKTAVFWVIHTSNSLNWTPGNLLFCFWKCFKLLIHWVFIGECPNFFIPQNNMFRFKVTGSIQTQCFNKLYGLYSKGISSLLLSKTLGPLLSQVVLNRALQICTNESSIITNDELDICSFQELCQYQQCLFDVKEFAVLMIGIEIEISKRLTPYQEVTIQFMTSDILRNTAMILQSYVCPNKIHNKVNYKSRKVTMLLKLSCSIGCVSEILYLAMHFYKTRRYEQSLSCLQKAQERMSMPHIFYYGRGNIDIYRHYTVGMSLSHKIRNVFLKQILLHFLYPYVDELILEQKIGVKNGFPILFIPPLVMLHMLFILNHHRLGDTVRSQKSLQDLQSLFDGVLHTDPEDISWQILGICQQICGDFPGALESYQHSLQQKPFTRIQEATHLRMKSIQ